MNINKTIKNYDDIISIHVEGVDLVWQSTKN